MPTPSTPYARLLVAVDGGFGEAGGTVCALGHSIQLSAENSTGWGSNTASPVARWEISSFPQGFDAPAGWSTDVATGAYYVLSNSPPPSFDVDIWGKYMLRLLVDGGVKNGLSSADMEDTGSGISVLSPSGLRDLGVLESKQWGASWVPDHQENLRAIDAGLTTAANAASGGVRSPVRVATTANITLSGTQTIDGISAIVGDRVLVKNQSAGAANGIYSVASSGWSRSTDANSTALLLSSLSVAVQQGTTNAGKTFVLVTQPPITLGATSLRFIPQGTTIDARVLALSDGSTDDTANIQGSFLVAPEVVYSQGSGAYKLATTGTIGGAGKTHRFARGAMIHIPSGVTLTIDGTIEAAHDQQIFQIDSGATLVWGAHAPREAHAAWFGAVCGGGDDALGIAAAVNAIATNGGRGGRVRLSSIGQGYYSAQSQIKIGGSGSSQAYQGVELVGDTSPILGGATATIRCDVDLGAGNAVVLVQNAAHFKILDVGIDAQHLADHCLQFRSDTLLGSAFGEAHRNSIWWSNFRNARIHNVLNGDYVVQPTCSGATFTATAHPLINGDQVYFRLRFPGLDAPPTGFAVDAFYYVVGRTANTFGLSATMGGSAITASDTGTGIWLLGKLDLSDQSQFVAYLCDFYGATFSHFHQPGEESLSCGLVYCEGQGLLDAINANGVAAGVTANASADTVTIDAGTLINGDIVAVFPHGSTDTIIGGLSPDTLYCVIGASSASATAQLSATIGGSAIDLTSTGSGCRLLKIGAPYYFVTLDGGSIHADSCETVAFYEDFVVSGTHLREGSSLTATAHQSQSWRFVNATMQGRTFAPQVGGVTLLGCVASDIWGGSRASVKWNLGLSAALVVVGGEYTRDIAIANAVSPSTILGPNLSVYGSDNGFQATVRGSLGKLIGHWSENGTLVQRGANITTTGAARIGDHTGTVTLDGTFVNIVAPAGAGPTNGVLIDVDVIHLRNQAATSMGDWTYPSGNVLFAVVGSRSITMTGVGFTADAGAGTFTAKAGSQNVFVASANTIVIDSSALGTGYLNFKTKTGQPIYADSDGFNFRNAASGQYLNATEVTPGAGDAAITGRVSLAMTSSSVTSMACNGHGGFKVDSSGQISFYGGATIAQQTRAGALTVAAGTPSTTTTADVGATFSQSTLNNQIATLATKINALESIIHQVGIST